MASMTEEEKEQIFRQKEAEDWKAKGNQAYKDKKFLEAI